MTLSKVKYVGPEEFYMTQNKIYTVLYCDDYGPVVLDDEGDRWSGEWKDFKRIS